MYFGFKYFIKSVDAHPISNIETYYLSENDDLFLLFCVLMKFLIMSINYSLDDIDIETDAMKKNKLLLIPHYRNGMLNLEF